MARDGRVKLLTIDDNMLRAMMNDPQIVKVLPALKSAKELVDSVAKGKKNCHRCKKDKDNLVAQGLRAARSAVANARGGVLRELKRILNAKSLRVLAKNGRGQTIKWTL